jgi:hypothetical protein
MMIYLAEIFCWLCVSTFAIATNDINLNTFYPILVINSTSFLYFIITLYVFVKAIEEVKGQVKILLLKIYKNLNEKCDVNENNELRMFAHQIINLPVNFGCDFIDFDWKLLFKVGTQLFYYLNNNLNYFAVHINLRDVFHCPYSVSQL